MARTSKPSVIDLFAGAGLFSHAFHREGFDVVRAVELERVAAATHSANLTTPVDVGNIIDFGPPRTMRRPRCRTSMPGLFDVGEAAAG